MFQFSTTLRDLSWRAFGVVALACGLAACGGSGSSGSSSTPPSFAATIADGRAAIQQYLSDTGTPSGTVALVYRDRIVWAQAFGTVDQQPTPDTMYCIGSESKVIAVAAVMMLVDQGKIDLDTPLVHYLPDFSMLSPEYTQITVRMLLNHSAGFGGTDFRNLFALTSIPGYSAGLQQAFTEQRLKHDPGYMEVYCNDCFTMVEPLIASVTGTPFTQFVTAQILTPLGMTHSQYALAPFQPGSFAPGYINAVPEGQEFGQGYAAGGLYTTPSDMARFAMMLMNGGEYHGTRILSSAAVAEMGSDQTKMLTFNPVPYPRGLGWDTVADAGFADVGIRAWHKKGGTDVYESDFLVAPDQRLAVMVSFAKRTLLAGQIGERILLHALAERHFIPAVPSPLPSNPKPEQTPSDADLAAIAGNYANKNGPIRVHALPDRTLTIDAPDGTSTGLKLRTDGTFSSDAHPNVSYRAIIGDGRRYLLQSKPTWDEWSGYYIEEQPYAQLLGPMAPLSAAWQKRVGQFWLAVNVSPDEFLLGNGFIQPRFNLSVVDWLPGYVFASSPWIGMQVVDPSVSDTTAQMFLKIPVDLGRDLNDVDIVPQGGEEWVRYGSTLYRPQATVPVLPLGASTVTIGSEGYSEWRQMSVAGSITFTGASAWKIYGPDFALPPIQGTGDGTATVATPGSYVMICGASGSAIAVNVAQ